MLIKGANLNLYEHDGGCLKFKKNDVCHLEFFCTRIFYRLDILQTRILSLLHPDCN